MAVSRAGHRPRIGEASGTGEASGASPFDQKIPNSSKRISSWLLCSVGEAVPFELWLAIPLFFYFFSNFNGG